MRNLWLHAYGATGLTFMLALLLEWQVPGLVSTVVPVYWLGLFAIVCGALAMRSSNNLTPTPLLRYSLLIAFGLWFGLIVFQDGADFGPYRLVLALVVASLPVLIFRVLELNKN